MGWSPFVMAYGAPELTVEGPPAMEEMSTTDAWPEAFRKGKKACITKPALTCAELPLQCAA